MAFWMTLGGVPVSLYALRPFWMEPVWGFLADARTILRLTWAEASPMLVLAFLAFLVVTAVGTVRVSLKLIGGFYCSHIAEVTDYALAATRRASSGARWNAKVRGRSAPADAPRDGAEGTGGLRFAPGTDPGTRR